MIIIFPQLLREVLDWKPMGQYIMRSLNIERLLDFGVRCKKQIEQDEEGNDGGQRRICAGCENSV
jgi:hypothetical protein